MIENVIVVIPSLNPDEKLAQTITGLQDVGFTHFVLVDDGSDSEHQQYFPAPNDHIALLRHHVNRGKGAALKTAFRFILKKCTGVAGVITVDGDGQHHPDDVAACARALMESEDEVILGCRDFSGKDVPARSRFGNQTTSRVFRLLCGMRISDTQTGLRGFPVSVLPLLLEVRGDRFEYETNMLLRLKQNRIPIKEVKIRTLYIEENKSSHFKPIRDSLRIYGFLLGFLCSSLFSCVVDIAAFYLLRRLFAPHLGNWTILCATLLARLISTLINFQINRKRVFASSQRAGKTIVKYYTLAVPQMLISAGAVYLLSSLIGGSSGIDTLIKAVVDTILFFVSYRIQQNWVFAAPAKQKEEAPAKKEPAARKKLTVGNVVRRILLSLGTILLMVLVTVYSALFVVARGPSKSLRNMLVLSAKQASATKWVPSLFLSKDTIQEILTNSEKIDVSTLPADTLIPSTDDDEWKDAQDGMRLEYIQQSKFKAYLLIVRDPARVSVGVSSTDFQSATAGRRIFDIVKQYNAVAAINGGEFADPGGKGTGARPMGLTYSGGKAVWSDGLTRTFIGFDKNNRLICKSSMTAAQAEKLGIRDGVSFQYGNVLIDQKGEEVKLYYSNNNTGTAQRTAIGQRADGAVLLLTTDGRAANSIGATRNDVIDLLVKYGAVSAGMLDGGSSTMMYYRDYYDKYGIDKTTLDTYQQQGIVNRYKAFTTPRRIPTFFIVSEE